MRDMYTGPVGMSWSVPTAGSARFSWEYGDGRDRLLALYQKGRDKQWDSVKRIDWSIEVDPFNVLGVPDQSLAIYGTKYWDQMTDAQHDELRMHAAAWQFSQFLHGEQGALVCASRIVESVPDLDSKFYGATQVMDEARHVEIYSKFLQEKVGVVYPINSQLQNLLGETLSDSRWDMPYLGMQVLIEGLALAAFGLMRDMTTKPLPRQILAYVMQDEARHVAFGRLALRDYYKQITEAERREREDFVIEGCYLMRDRIRSMEVWERFGIPEDEMRKISEESQYMRMFRSLLFSRIVPCVRDIGLWGDRLRKAYEDMGVLDMARQDLEVLMSQDEDIAEKLDRDRFAADETARKAEVESVIADAAQT
jgi:P-aminobenzoate N-oxygenase AurF